jgi:2-polyprenyl-3-methyl-5-hydroxy-6-metoxy-1,4-benzoquinol methylase
MEKKMNNFKFGVQTQSPIAFDSLDHTHPEGTINDNYSKIEFIEDVENFFPNRPLTVMDLGCAGGLLVHDFVKRGHIAMGLEGSFWNIHYQLHEWPALFNKNLFTCDVSREYQAFIENEQGQKYQLQCDLITAWEGLCCTIPFKQHSCLASA